MWGFGYIAPSGGETPKSGSADDFDAAEKDYQGALETLGTSPSDSEALEAEESSWKEMASADEELETRNNAGLALAVTGGLLVATGIALLSVGRRRRGRAA